MKKTTNDRIRVRIEIPAGKEALVKELDRIAKNKNLTRGQYCASILEKAVGRVSFSPRGVTHRKGK